MDYIKTEVVNNWTRPLTTTDIRSFLVFAGYYHRFVDDFSSIAAPLTALTKKKAKLEWTETCEKIFRELKERLTSNLVRTLPKCVKITSFIVMNLGFVWVVFL